MATNYQGTKDEQRALDTFVKLVRAAEAVGSRVETHFAPLKLTVSQFGVLEAILHLGPLYQKELGRRILRSSGNITMVVDNLEKRKLVKRVRDANDRRHYQVELTDMGDRLIRAFFPRHVKRIVDEMGVLTKKEQDLLGRLCRKVGLGTDAQVRPVRSPR